MQRIINITRFGGLYTNPHQEDIPDSAASFSLNVDPMALSGTLQGVPVTGASYTANGTALPNITEADWLKTEVSGSIIYDLVYIDKSADDISVVSNFYAAEASRALTDMLTSGNEPSCIKTFNNAAQIGRGNGAGSNSEPKVVYRLPADRQIFNGTHDLGATAPHTAGLHIENGYCSNQLFTVDTLTANTGVAPQYFQPDILYNYGVSLLYDNLQESDMNIHASGVSDVAAFQTVSVEILVTTGYSAPEDLDSRITAIKIYRAESSDESEANLGLYRLIKTISINSTSWTRDGASNDIHLTYSDDGSYEGGATYEEETGIPESITLDSLARHYIHYKLNEVGGGYHWVTNGYVPFTHGVDTDWGRYIFRSKKFRPNMFDWTRDFLVLPKIPTALAFFMNYLYAFTDNEVYKINPELLIIEDVFTGAGCSNRQAVAVTEFGMFFCNLNACYQMHPEGVIETISDAISEDSPIHTTMDGWRTMANFTLNDASAVLDKLMVFYETDKRSVLFFVEGTNVADTLEAFAYFIPTKEWYYWRLGTYNNITVNSGAFNGKDGEIYVSGDTGTGRLFAAATFTNSGWASKEFGLDEPSQNKSWNMVKWDAVAGSGAVTVSYATDGTSAVSSGTPATSGAWINTYKKTFQIYATTTSNARLDSLDIIVRPLYGKR